VERGQYVILVAICLLLAPCLLGGLCMSVGLLAFANGFFPGLPRTVAIVLRDPQAAEEVFINEPATPTSTSLPLVPTLIWTPTPYPTSPPSPTATPSPTHTPVPTLTPTPSPTLHPPPPLSDEQGRCIVINQNEQLMFVFENGVQIKAIPVSTGKPDLDNCTPAWRGWVGSYWGTFYNLNAYADDAWYLFKARASILIHGAPYIYRNERKVYQDLEALGNYPSSHGCIRLHPDDARWFTAWGPKGVPIIITALNKKCIP
jgi:lipoprotein-anchoring transpeptidase ErfK/SrfK